MKFIKLTLILNCLILGHSSLAGTSDIEDRREMTLVASFDKEDAFLIGALAAMPSPEETLARAQGKLMEPPGNRVLTCDNLKDKANNFDKLSEKMRANLRFVKAEVESDTDSEAYQLNLLSSGIDAKVLLKKLINSPVRNWDPRCILATYNLKSQLKTFIKFIEKKYEKQIKERQQAAREAMK